LGNTTHTLYYYGPSNTAGQEWGAVDNSGEFMSYQAAQITYCSLNQLCTTNGSTGVERWERVESWQGPRGDPNPRRGRMSKVQVRSWEYGTLLAETKYDWEAYQLDGANQWSNTPTDKQTRNNDDIYHVVWVRLEGVDEWSADAGRLTRHRYENNRQGGGQYGNLTETVEWSHPEANLNQATWDYRVDDFATRLTKLRTTVSEYFPRNDASGYVVNRPGRVTVYNVAGLCLSEERRIYDNADGVYVTPPVKGLLSKVERALSICWSGHPLGNYDPAWAITRYAYDLYGNTTGVNDLGADSSGAGDDITLTSYDSFYRLFPVEQWKEKNPLFRETAAYYGVNASSNGAGSSDSFWGAQSEHCGVNEVCVRQSYDEFGRPLRRWEAVTKGSAWAGNELAQVRYDFFARGALGLNGNVTLEWRAPRCYGGFTRRVYDGLGQLVQEQGPQQDWRTNVDGCSPGLNYAEVDVNYAYDSLGRQARVSVPTATTVNWVNRPANWGNGYTAVSYDALGRVVSTSAPNGEQTQTSYLGRAISVIGVGRGGDVNKVLRWQEVDGLGNLLRLRTYNPNGGGWTLEGEATLSHDALGRLTRVDHPGGVGATTLGYDLGGRKTSMSDPDLGGWSYAYDRQGRLSRQTDAGDVTTCLYYDNLGRLLGKHLRNDVNCPVSAPGYEVSYSYDAGHSSSNRSRGQLTQAQRSGIYTRLLSYNNVGLLASETATIVGAPQSYTTQYGYDAYQRLISTTYPDGEVVSQGYNSMGLAANLSGNQAGVLVDGTAASGGASNGVSYDEAGRLRLARLTVGGLWRSLVYAPWAQQNSSGGQLTGIWVGTQPNWANVLSLDYSYDSFGNVKTLWENGVGQSFVYDGQNRLTSAHGRSYAYDAAGRLTSYEGTSQSYNGNRPAHGVKNSGYGYDLNGNLTARPTAGGTQTLVWDGENRLASVSGGGLASESYLYDDAGQRVKVVRNGVAVYYPFPFYEVENGTVVKYYFFAGQRVAMKRNGVLMDSLCSPQAYLHNDHLGSPVLTTSSSATASQKYYAYGKVRSYSGSFPTRYQFTGQHIDDSDLAYMNARYYDRRTGQFISPDSLVPDAGLLMDYNRFMYARGNPMKYNDPSRHYSDQALMTHFGCETWSCVESFFADDGDYAAFQGWLDILIAAEDGDPVEIMIGTGNSVYLLSGRFNTLDGKIVVESPQLDAWGSADSADYAWGGVWNEHDFAKMALMGVGEANHSAGYRTSRAANLYDVRELDCRHTDCVAATIDGIGVMGSTLMVASPACAWAGGIGAGICYGTGRVVSTSSLVAGVGWTGYQAWQGELSRGDMYFTIATTAIGIASRDERVGLIASLAQFLWDIR
jgi:RHS repeat-associated protein